MEANEGLSGPGVAALGLFLVGGPGLLLGPIGIVAGSSRSSGVLVALGVIVLVLGVILVGVGVRTLARTRRPNP